MATRTTNLGLIKPDLDDNIDVTQLNANSDIIDGKVKENDDNINAVKQELPKYLPLTGGTLTGDLQTANLNVGGHIYKTSDDKTLIIGGGTNYDKGATLDLCGNERDEIYAQLHCNNNYFQVHSNGNTLIGGNRQLLNKDGTSITMKERTGVSYLECNSSGDIYAHTTNAFRVDGIVKHATGELQLRDCNDKCNVAINPDGNVYVNGVQIWKGNYFTPNGSSTVAFGYWILNDYDMILKGTVYNPNNAVDTVTITFPKPFLNDGYTVVANMRTHGNYSGVRINADYRTAVANCTSTGMTIARDSQVDTEFLIIGRIK